MASRPTDVEAVLGKRPVLTEVFNSRSPPNGPSAPLVSVRLAENPSVSLRVEKVVGDTDFRAAEAIPELFFGGVRQSQITKLLSVGLLGVKKHRRLVPTEWSITAVDDILGKEPDRQGPGLPGGRRFTASSATGPWATLYAWCSCRPLGCSKGLRVG